MSKIDAGQSSRLDRLPRPIRSFLYLAVSEWRVTIYTWALLVSYLIATDLKPLISTFILLAVSNYFLTLSIYVLNDVTDIQEDSINTSNRPLPSGKVTRSEGIGVFIFSMIMAFSLVMFLGAPTIALYGVSLFLGLAYSFPRIRAKERFPDKLIVGAMGGAVWSLTGGVTAQVLNPLVFFAAIAFALSTMLAILLGDIADLRGDSASGVKSLPVIIGARRSVWVAMSIPAIIGALVLGLFRPLQLNIIFVIVVISLSCYSSYVIGTLLNKHGDSSTCRKVKIRWRLIIPFLQLAFLLALVAI
ncbi:MAG: UbiA prenyltransferase family protein [Nitrososphaerales archaeon]